MAKYDLNSVHVFNKFLWSRLEAQGLMNRTEFNNLIPLIPTQQEPVFNDMSAGKPFIVYTFVVSNYDPDIWSHIEQVTYRIYSDDEGRLRKITNFIIDLCRRFDWTADEVNTWIDTLPAGRDEKKFDFKYVQVVGATGPEPTPEEGGRQHSSVTVRFAFTMDEYGHVAGSNMGMRS